MATRRQKLKVGTFLLACFGLIAAGFLLVSGLYEDKGQTYWIEFDESVLGLNEGGIVEYLGVPVGKVKEILVTKNNMARVEVTIDPRKVQLHDGVEAQLVMYSLAAGTMAVSLAGGDHGKPALEPGNQIPTKPSTMTAVSSRIEELMDNLTQITKAINTGLAGIEEGDLKATVDKFNTLLDEGKVFLADGSDLITSATGTIDAVKDDTKNAIQKVGDLSADLRKLTNNIDELVTISKEKVAKVDVEETQAQLQRVLTNIANLTEKLDTSAAKIDTVTANALHEADNIEYSLRVTLSEISTAVGTTQGLIEELKANPAALLHGKMGGEKGPGR